MNVTLNYFGQLRQFADTDTESREYSEGTALDAALRDVADSHGEKFAGILFDPEGALRPSVMVLVNETPVNKADLPGLSDGDSISLLAAIAGG